jgi:hypothetical protein
LISTALRMWPRQETFSPASFGLSGWSGLFGFGQ